MTATRKSYTKEFKLEALRLAKVGGKTVSQVERELDLSKGSLFRWRHALARNGCPSQKPQTPIMNINLGWAMPKSHDNGSWEVW